MSDHKTGVSRALQGFLEQDQRPARPKRKNSKPEFELTYKPVKKWLYENGFSCHRVESKAVRGPDGGFYRGMAVAGMTDIVGCDPHGYGVFIELKAPGRRASLKPHQREFLVDKIKRGAFACCTDSVEHLSMTYEHWNKTKSKEFLIANLPILRVSADPIFKETD
jgi:hypothetical protein